MRVDVYENDEFFASAECDSPTTAAREALHYGGQCDGKVTYKIVLAIDTNAEDLRKIAA